MNFVLKRTLYKNVSSGVTGYSFKRNSKCYSRYLYGVITKYNKNGKKTIVLSLDAFFPVTDGVVKVVDNYARLLKDDFNVLVVAPSYFGKIFIKDYPVLGVKSFFSKSLNYQVAIPFLDFKFRRYIKKLKIDLIHCHSPFFIGNAMKKIHKKRSVPMVCTFHSQYKQDFEKAVKSSLIVGALMKEIMSVFLDSDEVWTMNKNTENTLKSYGYFGNVRLIPNGTEYGKIKNYDFQKAFLKEKFGVENKTVFLFVGRLVTQKNVLFIADVLKALKDKGLDFLMFFVGDGADKKILQDRIEKNGLTSATVFTGHISDSEKLSEYYILADLLLFPSLYDTSSIVQIEASARKTPVAFLSGSVTSYSVIDGHNGFLLPFDTDKFADGVFSAINDKDKLKQVGENAYNELFVPWEDIISKAKARYGELFLKP